MPCIATVVITTYLYAAGQKRYKSLLPQTSLAYITTALTLSYSYLAHDRPFNMKLFVLSLLAGATALDFQGTGQLRALQGVPEGDERGTDLGCLTVEGKWTVDEARCGLFSGARKDNLTITVTTLAGIPCGHDPGTFVCREGLTAASTMWMVSWQ